MSIALVHDYLTQQGGAERVLLSLLAACPGAPVYTSLYDREGTYDEFQHVDVRVSALNRAALLRRNHRLALPLLARTFSRMTVDADIVLCSSSGWAHGVHASGRKIVCCYTPARWLYQPGLYIGRRRVVRRAVLGALARPLRRWDRRAALTASRYLAISTVVRDRIWECYGVEAEIVHPPHRIAVAAPKAPVAGVEPGFALCVSRLLAYKNVDAVIDAFRLNPARTLVVVGTGPEEQRLLSRAPANVHLLGSITDAQLRWLYAHASALISASYEDYGLTPLEAAAFGTPCAVLRGGGFLDTVVEGITGTFFDVPSPRAIADAVERLHADRFDAERIREHTEAFSEERFVRRIREIVGEETKAGSGSPESPLPVD